MSIDVGTRMEKPRTVDDTGLLRFGALCVTADERPVLCRWWIGRHRPDAFAYSTSRIAHPGWSQVGWL